MSASTWRRLRVAVQILALFLYLFLFFSIQPQQGAFTQTDLFFRLDPLLAATAMLASRRWIATLSLALLTIMLTLILGRFWCGWLCPLGTLLDGFRFPSAERRARRLSPQWRKLGKLILLLVLAAAVFGNLTLLVLDPLTLVHRAMTTVVLPAVDKGVTAFETAFYTIPALRPVVNTIERALRGTVLPVEPSVFLQSGFIALVFIMVLGLNFLGHRFWCRYVCPLGALLGFLSKFSLYKLRIGEACKGCARCERACQLGAIQTDPHYEIVASECTLCLDCLGVCREGDIQFSRSWHRDPMRMYDPARREALAALASGFAGAALLQIGAFRRSTHPLRLRPPGVEDERVFLAHCLRCGVCMRVCPTSGLQPVLVDSAVEGLWTPVLTPRLGFCDYGCNACGQSCPSGAIPGLSLTIKRSFVIGAAHIDPERCLPWSQDVPCIVCEEMCPIPEKAVKLEDVVVTDEAGASMVLQRPEVLEHLCIGCGVCEYKCPVEGEAAIRIRRLD